MTGPAEARAALAVKDAVRYRAEGIIVSAIPGASHCATEGLVIRRVAARDLDIPVCEITVPPLADSSIGQLATRFEGFFEIIRDRRRYA